MNQLVDDFTNKKTTGSVLLVENIKNDYNEAYIYQIARKLSIEITFKYCQTISELILNRLDDPRTNTRPSPFVSFYYRRILLVFLSISIY